MLFSLLLCLLPAVVFGSVDDVLRRANAAPVVTRHFMDGGRERIQDGSDMLLSPKQFQRLYQGVKGRSDASTAGNAWTDGIVPYTFRANDYTPDEVKLIKEAMNTWENLTCVRFVEDAKATNRLLINTGRGGGNQCTAVLGMEGGEQGVNLAKVCLTKDTIEHELGHALGMIHEHQRPNRDAFVRINYYGIEENNVGWLAKYAQGSDDKKGVEYDYGSIMHYSGTSFSKGSETTIYTRDPDQQYRIGNAYGPTFLDAKFINLLYGCSAKCKSPRKCGDDCLLTHDCKCLCKKDVPTGPCEDRIDYCDYQAESGECQKNPKNMYDWCRKSCGMCGDGASPAPGPCEDKFEQCDYQVESGECQKNPKTMYYWCRKSCGMCGDGASPAPGTEQKECKDNSADCPRLAAEGNCHRDAEKMLKQCRKSCEFCPEKPYLDPTNKPGCVDYDTVCYYMKDQGWCRTMPQSMGTSCAQACNTCNQRPQIPDSCQDHHIHCWIWTASGLCGSGWMVDNCRRSCGICAAADCEDKNRHCEYWHREGMCETYTDYMRENCPKSCNFC